MTERGTPAGKAELDSPFPNDFPPSVVAGYETGKEANRKVGFLILSSNYLRVYNIAEMKTAPYQTIQGYLDRLQRLLKKRPKKGPNMGKSHADSFNYADTLPDYPPRNAEHLLEAKVSYLDAAWGAGLFYVSQFSQGIGEIPNNQQLVYVFQGLSKDGKYFVSADFCVSHPKDPQRPEDAPGASSLEPATAHETDAERITERIQIILDKEADSSYIPSLRALREWVATLKIH